MATIREIQTALSNKGFDPGSIDGILGPKTEAAIVAFKASIGYRARPYVGPLTLAALFDDRIDEASNENDDRPSWLRVACSYLGLREYPGNKHNKQIVEWWSKIRAPFNDDETPWCAAFVGGVLEECEIVSSRSAAARSYSKWGVELTGPAVGAVVVFWRGKPDGWAGHVGFVVGKDQNRNLMVVGGNQGNAVNVKPFDTARVLAYRWPKSQPAPNAVGWDTLPLVNSDGRLSTNEA